LEELTLKDPVHQFGGVKELEIGNVDYDLEEEERSGRKGNLEKREVG